MQEPVSRGVKWKRRAVELVLWRTPRKKKTPANESNKANAVCYPELLQAGYIRSVLLLKRCTFTVVVWTVGGVLLVCWVMGGASGQWTSGGTLGGT